MRVRRLALALAGVVCFGPEIALAQSPAETAIRQWINTIDASPDWGASYRQLSYDQATDVATLSGLTVRSEQPGVEIAFETIAVAGYVDTPDGGYKARSVKADGGATKFGFSSVAISDVSLEGLTVPALSPFTYDRSKPFTSLIRAYAAIAKVGLDSGRVGSIDVVQQLEGQTSRTSYGTLEIGNLHDGRLASFKGGPVKIVVPSPDGLLELTVGGIEGRDFDMAAYIHVYDPDAYVGGVGDMVWRDAIAHIAYRDIAVSIAGIEARVGEIVGERFRLRQPPKSFIGLYDSLFAMAADPTIKEPSEEQMMEFLKADFVNMFAAFAVGRFAMLDFEIKAAGIDRASLADFHMNDFSIDGLGEIGVEGLELAVPEQGALKLGRFAFGGITFPSLDAIKAAIAAAERDVMPDPNALMPHLGFVEVTGVDLRSPDVKQILVDRFRVDLGDYIGPIPTTVAAELVGLLVPASAIEDRQARQMFKSLGYDSVNMNYGLKLHWTESDSTVTVEQAYVSLKDMGGLFTSLSLAGLTRAAIENPETLEQALAGLSLTGAKLTFTDDSIVGKGLDLLAGQMKAPPDRFRQQFADAMPFLLSMTAFNDPKIMAIVQKSGLLGKLTPVVKSFIATPGSSITVTFSPPRPVTLPEIAAAAENAPDTLAGLLGMTFANEAGVTPPAANPAPADSGAPPAEEPPPPTTNGGRSGEEPGVAPTVQ